MALERLLRLCRNITDADGMPAFNSSLAYDPGLQDKDKHAILYIVVVLLFYSIGIIIGIITYLKREKEEIEEDKTYEDYMNFRSDPDKWARYFRVQRMIFHLNRVEREQDKKRRDLLQQTIIVYDEEHEAMEEGRRAKRPRRKPHGKGVDPCRRSNPEVGLQQLRPVQVVVESCHELTQCARVEMNRDEDDEGHLLPSMLGTGASKCSTLSLDVATERMTGGRINSL